MDSGSKMASFMPDSIIGAEVPFPGELELSGFPGNLESAESPTGMAVA
ncbi:hypothetical protein SCG7086_AR_00100 [Chlamydiales bacterium SCGC AG-110-P3]|nr:hypothetical protein SCG7086_AR_00100 [Chlamydiales bacterium SCGC AG-110-P3]